MIFGYFTERPYRHLDEDKVLENKAFFAVSNSNFDREKRPTTITTILTNIVMPRKWALMPLCSMSTTATLSAWAA